jgi:diketogulonate reductase-like aldo/keto reductase
MTLTRRAFLRQTAALAALAGAPQGFAAPGAEPIRRPIPSSGELLPVIGLGTWIAFDVGAGSQEQLRPVLQAFFDLGGSLIDSSPMYGRAEAVVGALLPDLPQPRPLFAATKVWTRGRRAGIEQMEASRALWGVPRFDLMQIHNLVDWETHVETLKAWKAEGRVRYIGITTSHGQRHEELERAMAREPFDFVQLTYSLADRRAERRLLPLAQERRMAVIANRPFDGANLFSAVRAKPLPAWAAEFDCASWAQFFLKFIVSHPAVTCAIPATSRLEHMRDNMGANFGRLSDAAMRTRMAAYFAGL